MGAISYSVWDVINNFLLIDATDRSKISSDQKSFFIASSLYPLSIYANTPFKTLCKTVFKTFSVFSFQYTVFIRILLWFVFVG